MCIELKRIIKPMDIIIRNITDKDHYEIELVAKRAFWNLNMPGCDEHYLVHRLWNEPCYIPEISLAATTDEKVVGAILYSKAIIETDHSSIEVLTFGPLCVDPDHQRMGIGKKLLLESMKKSFKIIRRNRGGRSNEDHSYQRNRKTRCDIQNERNVLRTI